MGFKLKTSALFAASPLTGLATIAGSSSQNPGDAMLSGIPFIGEGFAAQQANNFTASQNSAKMKFEQDSAQKQMEFQKEMSNTEVQRRKADMIAAGINPVLAAGEGAGGASGAMASGSSGSGQMGSGAGSSAQFLKSMMNKEREAATAGIEKTKADTETAKVTKNVQLAQENVLKNSAKNIQQDIKLKQYQEPGAKNQADFERDYGKLNRNTNAILDTAAKGINSANSMKNLINPFSWKNGDYPKGGLKNRSSAKGTKKSMSKTTVIDSKTGEILDQY